MQRDAAWSAESLRREEEGRDEEDTGSGGRRKKAMSDKDIAEERGIRMRLLEANRTSRGSKTGGILSFTGLVVVGNGNVSTPTPAFACAARLPMLQWLECLQHPATGGCRNSGTL